VKTNKGLDGIDGVFENLDNFLEKGLEDFLGKFTLDFG